MRRRLAGLAVLAAAAVPLPAVAHPHVWIDTVLTLHMATGRLASVGVEWRFDPYFSSFVAEEFDADADGRLDPAEQRTDESQAFAAVADFGWVTHLPVDGERQAFPRVEGFAAALDGGTLVYRFRLPLAEPADPARQTVGISTFDESFYVEVALDAVDPVRFDGRHDCHFQVRTDLEPPIYQGLVTPQTVLLRCGPLPAPGG